METRTVKVKNPLSIQELKTLLDSFELTTKQSLLDECKAKILHLEKEMYRTAIECTSVKKGKKVNYFFSNNKLKKLQIEVKELKEELKILEVE